MLLLILNLLYNILPFSPLASWTPYHLAKASMICSEEQLDRF
jgi:hypothetical protein